MSNVTAKSLHPIPHAASVAIGSRIVTILFNDASPKPVSEEVGAMLSLKVDNEGKPMYDVSGLKKEKAPKPLPIPEVKTNEWNQ